MSRGVHKADRVSGILQERAARLHADFLIDAHDVRAFGCKLERVVVGVAQPFDIGSIDRLPIRPPAEEVDPI